MGTSKTMNPTTKVHSDLPTFKTENYLILFIGILIIILGLILMSGEGSNETTFNPDIFSVMRIRVAPLVCLIGFSIEGYGIMK